MKKIIILIISYAWFFSIAYGQLEEFNPKSPEAATLINNIEVPVGKYTGTFSYSVPVDVIKQGEVAVPVSLDYRGASKKNTDVASSAGLGWTLNAGAMVTRKVNGLPDEHEYGFLNTRNQFTYEQIEDMEINEDKNGIKDNFIEGCWDTKPDEFYFNLEGVSGTFIFPWNATDDFIISCDKSIKIEGYTFSGTDIMLPSGLINNPINKWIITDHKGVKYTFDEVETTSNTGGAPPCSYGIPEIGDVVYYGQVSSWYLTKKESLTDPNKYIALEYINNGYETENLPMESYSIPDPTSNPSCWTSFGEVARGQLWNNNTGDDPLGNTYITSKSISKIFTSISHDSITFKYLNDRNDINTNKLNEIFVYRGGNNIAKKYKLDYYANGSKKLLLEKIKVSSNDQTVQLPPYQFEYHNPIQNADHPFSCDHWGFPNNSRTDTNLPKFTVANPHFAGGYHTFEGSDRSPDLDGSQSYIMKKITLPTGGTKHFEYELNSATNINGTWLDSLSFLDIVYDMYEKDQQVGMALFNQGVPYDNTGNPITSFDCGTMPGLTPCKSGTFTIVNDDFNPNEEVDASNGTIVEFEFDGMMCQEFTVTVSEVNGNGGGATFIINANGVDPVDCVNPDPSIIKTIILPPGTFTAQIQRFVGFHARVDNPNTPQNEEVDPWLRCLVKYKNQSQKEDLYGVKYKSVDIGGVRVKNIKTLDQNGELIQNTSYDYTYDDGKTSGVIYGIPQYYDKYIRMAFSSTQAGANGQMTVFDWNENLCKEWSIATSSKAYFGTTKGSHIGYAEVKEYNTISDDNQNFLTAPNGYINNLYTSPIDYGDIITRRRPYTHVYSQSYMTGLPKKTEYFKKQIDVGHQIIKSLANQYQQNKIFAPCITISEGLISLHGPIAHYANPSTGPDELDFQYETTWLNQDFWDIIAFDTRPYQFGYANLTKSTTTTYNENGNQPITDIVEYQYDPTYNNMTSQKSWRNLNTDNTFDQDANEDYTYTTISYAYETGIGGPGSPEVNAANMVGIPMKTITQYNADDEVTNIIVGNEVHYSAFTRAGIDYIKPFRFYEIKGGNMVKNYELGYGPFPGGLNVSSKRDFNTEENSDNNYTKYIWNNDLLEEVWIRSDVLGDQITHYDYNTVRQLQRITNHNGQITEFVYDGLQRLDQVKSGKGTGHIAADGTVIAPAGTAFRKVTDYDYNYMLDANGNVLPNAKNSTQTTVSFPLDASLKSQVSRVIFDGLGREIYSEKDNFDADASSTVILNTKEYDDFGRLKFETNLGSGLITYSYEDAPLNRLLQVTTPTGITKTEYGNNTGNVIVDGKIYPAASLSSIRTIVEDGNNVEESRADNYTDFMGREIMNTSFVENAAGGLDEVNTKMAYNHLNQLSKIFPHLGEHYEYTYNQRGLLASKTIPNKGTMNYWYDKLERQVASDDPAGNIFVTVYDDLGREKASGLKASPLNYDSDTYASIDLTSAEIQDETNYFADNTNNPIDWIESTSTTNLVNGDLLSTSMDDYDDLGRLLQSTSKNHKGGEEINSITYNDADLVINSKLSHNANNASSWGNNLVLEWENTFDNAFRPKEVKFKDLNNSNWQTINALAYNDLNQVVQKKLHETSNGDWWQKIDYSYDNAGRLSKINEPSDLKCEQNTAELCDKSFNVTPTGNGEILEIFVTDIQYNDRDGALASIPLAYPYAVNQFNIDGFQNDVGNWLSSNGYIFDHIAISLEEGMITFGQTNIDLSMLLQSNTPKTVVNSNCCPIANVDLYAQTLTYQGNQIERMDWAVSCGNLQRYDFEYDMMHRLTDAIYSDKQLGSSWTASNFYDVGVSYDHIGNIRTLKRKANVNNNLTTIDDLTYVYEGFDINGNFVFYNKVGSIGDAGTPQGMTGSTNYTYDLNGNLKTDSQKGLTIAYNHFNLPHQVTKKGGDKIDFNYLSDMSKIQKETTINGKTKTKDYIGGVEYNNGKIEAIYHGDGRFTLDANGNQKYEYTLKDHLGNTRVSFTDVNNDGGINQTDILQENHYYPFGMQMYNNGVATTGTPNDYQYNGKELNEELGLDWYNYGFRMYDPAIARFTGVDPISEQYAFVSTYNYAENSPIGHIDLHGLQKLRYEMNFFEKILDTYRHNKEVNAPYEKSPQEAKQQLKETMTTLRDISPEVLNMLGEHGNNMGDAVGMVGAVFPLSKPYADFLDASFTSLGHVLQIPLAYEKGEGFEWFASASSEVISSKIGDKLDGKWKKFTEGLPNDWMAKTDNWLVGVVIAGGTTYSEGYIADLIMIPINKINQLDKQAKANAKQRREEGIPRKNFWEWLHSTLDKTL